MQVIHTISEGIVAFLMERGDHAKVMMRSVARELLATCVLRALMNQITPYNINKARALPHLASHSFLSLRNELLLSLASYASVAVGSKLFSPPLKRHRRGIHELAALSGFTVFTLA